MSTRFLSCFLQLTKTYSAEILLGIETDTLDNTGSITKTSEVPVISLDQLQLVQGQFSGLISQIPPIYSNLKIGGRRAHEIVRSGGKADLKPRQVTVSNLGLSLTSPRTIAMECSVSSGTYIRSLARDIALALGTCGHLTQLRRTRIGNFELPGQINALPQPGRIAREMDDFSALDFLGTLSLSTTEAERFFHGAPIPLADIQNTGLLRVTCEGRFIGLGTVDGNLLKPRKSYPN